MYRFFKRLLDVMFAYTLLLICYIPMILIAIIIKFNDGGPVIFRQVRIGMNGKSFVCYKFRTMRCDAPSELSTAEFTNAHEYITPIGIFLRKTSLDELPQLFNILVGEMSFVGPRPLIKKERQIHNVRNKYGVYKVRPGLTGLAQICGRDNLSDLRKAECDAIYVTNMSFLSDFNIILSTIIKVIKKEGASGCERTIT